MKSLNYVKPKPERTTQMPTKEGPYSKKDNQEYTTFKRPAKSADRDVSKDADRNAGVNNGFAGKVKE
jgi:hypothetical protein